ncbi:unnamed protein product [Acanthoscelides obtectus]|uniref:PiggyBac transposable element-derived protein domain-containing protein n=1 Tax=Acanthoscelides obtectus TaxID=200917 RepID=A0A9P0M0B6_ACAOB|nr:unnamed protein product [Acanthoscelides obtectus]CAK1651342.1 hypothetical protein AOBTE_LOCUS17203 [Acanthoscelides obtectus]
MYDSDDEIPLSELKIRAKGVAPDNDDTWNDDDYLPVASFASPVREDNTPSLWKDVPKGSEKEIPNFTSPKQSSGTVLAPCFKYFFDDDLLEHIVYQSNLYCTQNRPHKALCLSVSELEQFIGVTIFMPVFDLHRTRSYWSNTSRIAQIADIMSRERYEEIRRFIHFNNNDNMPDRNDKERNKLYKIQAMERQVSLRRKGTQLVVGIAPPEVSEDEYLPESDSEEVLETCIPLLDSMYDSDDEIPLSELKIRAKGVAPDNDDTWNDDDYLPVASFASPVREDNTPSLWKDVPKGSEKEIPNFTSPKQSSGTVLAPCFKYFFDDDLLEHIVYQSNLYCTQNRPHKALCLSVSELEQFIGVTIFMRCIRFTPYQKLLVKYK